MSQCPFHSAPADDPFRAHRESTGVLATTFQGAPVPMILRHKDVRLAAGDFQTYSNDAPFRVPIPSEEDVRSVRQLPIETDPPEHTEYRALVEPFFRQAKEPAYIARVESLLAELLTDALARTQVEVVREFALPLQSRALTYLLRVPESEAQEWISWGTHVFRDGGNGEAKGAALERYIQRQFDRAATSDGDDFFSVLSRARFRDRALSRDELVGFANLVFAGGRDTIIQSVAGVIGYLSGHPEALTHLREHPESINSAAEEFFRFISPLTHIGRVCPHDTDVKGVAVPSGERVSLNWASANRDASIFADPDELRLDRKPNPHLAFGSGPHNCLGALHARLLVRVLLRQLATRMEAIRMVSCVPHVEREADYARTLGYDALTVSFVCRS